MPSRRYVGFVGLMLLVIGALVLVSTPQSAIQTQVVAACFRTGTLLCALWLALPGLKQWSSRFFLISVIGLVVVLALWPKFFLLALGLLAALAFLKSRFGLGSKQTSRTTGETTPS